MNKMYLLMMRRTKIYLWMDDEDKEIHLLIKDDENHNIFIDG
jgi:hypothetical protein